jgi:alanyl-tRNA synthetase
MAPGRFAYPQGDKSLLWVNAGVTGLKKYFDGSEVPPCRRIVNVQKSSGPTISKTSAIPPDTIPSSRCSAISQSGIISAKEVIAWAVEILTDPVMALGCQRQALHDL